MKWRRIPKESCRQPTSGTYSDWKEILAKEGFHQCVYCAIAEARFGGVRNFHVEHFRPKGKKRFRRLLNDIRNLFYACAVCNTFKGDDWPNDPDASLSKDCFPDPSKVDYSDLFSIAATGILTGRNVAAKYVTEKLYLNRPQLIFERRYSALIIQLKTLTDRLESLIPELKQIGSNAASACAFDIAQAHNNLAKLTAHFHTLRVYSVRDVSKSAD